MKKKLLKIIGIILIQGFIFFNLNAQTELGTFQLGTLDSYFSSYFEPFATATAVSMGGGWYNTAKTHKIVGIDLSLLAFSFSTVPEDEKLIDPDDILLPTGMSLSSNADIPSLSGDKELVGPTLQQTVDVPVIGPQTRDIMPLFEGKGVALSGALNMFQIGIGLPKGTDLKIRFIPNIDLGVGNAFDLGKISMWGVGVQHDIKQWIPVIKEVPVLQISAVIGYSSMSMEYKAFPFPFKPIMFGATSSLPESTWNDQNLGIDLSSLVFNLVIGAKLPVVHPYVGLGFNKYSFDGGLKGTFPVLSIQADNAGTLTNVVEDTELDPVTIEASGTMPNASIGLRIKLAVITLWGQYTAQKYSMVTAGFGISIR